MAAALYFRGVTVVSPPYQWDKMDVLVADGRIQWRAPAGHRAVPRDAREIPGDDLILTPGWVELQINGAFGHDFTLTPEAIWDVAAQLPQLGLTAFLPTIITAPRETIARAQQVLLAGPPSGWHGARPLGLHIEGPFLNPERKGAHPPTLLRAPDPAWIRDWTRARGVRLVTLAPELPHALDLVRALRNQGVVVSMGHTMAPWEQAIAGFEAGITYGTHLFNAMRGFHHREPGAVGALLARPDIPVGLIVDGIHVHPGAVRLAWQAKGPGALTLVTDACAGLGMPPGTYRLGEMTIVVREHDARLPDGTLAGSIVRPDAALRNLMHFAGASLVDAVSAWTVAPARVLGLPHPHVAPGAPADLTLLRASDLSVIGTVIAGHLYLVDKG
ncbi:MAG: N-acetylglucosamine-6-phosphate deacetylase [Chloroflexi bacterium]|nr:N-acetylglucosamine-6-phosphate deacetylase [Chloroflexota bacterium]